jgi:hypothetical protein
VSVFAGRIESAEAGGDDGDGELVRQAKDLEATKKRRVEPGFGEFG